MLRGRGPAEREYYAPPTLMRARGGKRRVFELLLLALCRLYRVCILTKKELYRWTIPGVGFFLNIFIFLCVCVCICEIIFKNFFLFFYFLRVNFSALYMVFCSSDIPKIARYITRTVRRMDYTLFSYSEMRNNTPLSIACTYRWCIIYILQLDHCIRPRTSNTVREIFFFYTRILLCDFRRK